MELCCKRKGFHSPGCTIQVLPPAEQRRRSFPERRIGNKGFSKNRTAFGGYVTIDL
jgi:hypothetical protein